MCSVAESTCYNPIAICYNKEMNDSACVLWMCGIYVAWTGGTPETAVQEERLNLMLLFNNPLTLKR